MCDVAVNIGDGACKEGVNYCIKTVRIGESSLRLGSMVQCVEIRNCGSPCLAAILMVETAKEERLGGTQAREASESH